MSFWLMNHPNESVRLSITFPCTENCCLSKVYIYIYFGAMFNVFLRKLWLVKAKYGEKRKGQSQRIRGKERIRARWSVWNSWTMCWGGGDTHQTYRKYNQKMNMLKHVYCFCEHVTCCAKQNETHPRKNPQQGRHYILNMCLVDMSNTTKKMEKWKIQTHHNKKKRTRKRS